MSTIRDLLIVFLLTFLCVLLGWRQAFTSLDLRRHAPHADDWRIGFYLLARCVCR